MIAGVVTALLSRYHYRGSRKTASGSAAQPTDEVFIDPETGRKRRVWYDQRSGNASTDPRP